MRKKKKIPDQTDWEKVWWKISIRDLIESTKEIFRDSRSLRKALMIAYPVALQGMLDTVVNLVDALMVDTLGATAIAAVGLADKVFFVSSLLVFRIVSGNGVLAAQFWGSGDVKNIKKVLGLSLLLAMGGALFFVVPAIATPQFVMYIFTTSQDSIALGAKYLRLAALTYPLITLTSVYVAMLRAVNKVVSPVISSCIATAMNICLNYVLIFRKFGTPALGVEGAAIAIFIARVIEIGLMLGYVYIKKMPIVCGFTQSLGWPAAFVRKFATTSAPVIVNEFMWGLGVTMYSLVYGRMGDEAVAAITIATTIQGIVVVLFQGLSTATTVIPGNELGTGKSKRTEKCATQLFILQFIVTMAAAMVVIGIRWPIIGLYNITAEVGRGVNTCILIFAAYMPTKMFNYVNVVGVLRNDDDTKMCLFLDTSGVWVVGVPLAFLGVLMWHLLIYAVYGLVMLEEVYRAALGYIRYRQKKWLRNLAVGVP